MWSAFMMFFCVKKGQIWPEQYISVKKKNPNLIDEKLELDDTGATFMLTITLHTRTAEAEGWLG